MNKPDPPGEVMDMRIAPWARKFLANERIWLALRILSPFLVWGFLLFWFQLALQHP